MRRNCPRYQTAAEHPDECENPAYIDAMFLTFKVADEQYSISIGQVREIVQVSAITRAPHSLPHCTGTINLRGKVIPLLDLRLRFSKPAWDYHDRTCAIVTEVEKRTVGLVVDDIDQVTFIPCPAIQIPQKEQLVSPSYILGLTLTRDRINMILDTRQLLSPWPAAAQNAGLMSTQSFEPEG